MKMVKSLLLGSAAGLFAVAGAQAADLPVKAKAVEYVKICSLYGAGYYYVPGTDTCVKIGGYVRADYAVNASGSHGQAYVWNSTGGQYARTQDDYRTRARARITVDTRTQTEYGTLRSYINFGAQYTSSGDTYSGGGLSADAWFIQFAGFTFGRAYSFFEMPWETYGANYTAALLGGTDGSTFISNLIGYTAQLGNGVSASISLEDAGNRPGFVYNTTDASNPVGAPANRVAGGTFPDIVGNIQVDQAWGTAKVAGLAHKVRATYYGANETTGHPGDVWGWAVQGGLKVNLPWGPGDNVTVSGAYTEGDLQALFGGSAGFSNVAIFRGSSVFFGWAPDGVFTGATAATGTGIELVKGWGVNATLTHYWTPTLRTGVFGSYTAVDFGSQATAGICANWSLVMSAGATCDPDWKVWQIGTRTMWSPVANLDIGLEVLYSKFQTNNTGSILVAPGGVKPTGWYAISDQDVWSGMLRVQRNFWP
jgi:hypothetical protein